MNGADASFCANKLTTTDAASAKFSDLSAKNGFDTTISSIPSWATYMKSDFLLNLFVIRRPAVATTAACSKFDREDFDDVNDVVINSRIVLNVLAWITFSLCIVTILLAILFFLAASGNV